MCSLVKFIDEATILISKSVTESDLYYNYGRAIAFAEVLHDRNPCRRDYVQTINEIDEAMNARRMQGFAQ